ncbi:MAG: hypothetical protein OXC40_04205, partial [Proteobacteria bacterium]|nr:hypothetical protein [Pseudomonadota bacterium]
MIYFILVQILFFSVTLWSCTSTPETLSPRWLVAKQATQLSCDHDLLSQVTTLKPLSLHYLALGGEEGIYWGEGINGEGRRVFYHHPSRHMAMNQHYQTSTKVLAPSEKILLVSVRNKTQVVVFKMREIIPQDPSDAGGFELVISDLLTGKQLVQRQFPDFLYGSDLRLQMLSQDRWLLSGYVDHFLWHVGSFRATPSGMDHQVHALPATSVLQVASENMQVITQNFPASDFKLYVSRVNDNSELMVKKVTKDLPPTLTASIKWPFIVQESSIAFYDDKTLLIAMIGESKVGTKKTSDQGGKNTAIYLGRVLLGASDSQVQIKIDASWPLSSYA